MCEGPLSTETPLLLTPDCCRPAAARNTTLRSLTPHSSLLTADPDQQLQPTTSEEENSRNQALTTNYPISTHLIPSQYRT